MTKRISKKVREEAALICAIVASGPVGLDEYILPSEAAEEGIGVYPWQKALHVALAAIRAAEIVVGVAEIVGGPVSLGMTWKLRAAEAESLLRTGWTP